MMLAVTQWAYAPLIFLMVMGIIAMCLPWRPKTGPMADKGYGFDRSGRPNLAPPPKVQRRPPAPPTKGERHG